MKLTHGQKTRIIVKRLWRKKKRRGKLSRSLKQTEAYQNILGKIAKDGDN